MTRRRLNVLIRIALGLLLATAGLKLYGLGVSAVPRVGWFAQPGVQLAAGGVSPATARVGRFPIF